MLLFAVRLPGSLCCSSGRLVSLFPLLNLTGGTSNGIEATGIEPIANGIENQLHRPHGIEPNGIKGNRIESNGIDPNGIQWNRPH